MRVKNLKISSSEIITGGTYGLKTSPRIDGRGFFNHTLYLYFGTVGGNCTALDIYIDIFSPACYNQEKNPAPAIRYKIGTVDFTVAGPYDSIYTFGGHAVTSAILPGAVLYEYKFVVFNQKNVPGSGPTFDAEIKNAWLTMADYNGVPETPKGV